MVDALKDKYSLPTLLERIGISKSSYYYQESALRREDKYSDVRKKIMELFYENKARYGYRRIHSLLKREGIILSEKVIRRIMREDGLTVKTKKAKEVQFLQRRNISCCAKHCTKRFSLGPAK